MPECICCNQEAENMKKQKSKGSVGRLCAILVVFLVLTAGVVVIIYLYDEGSYSKQMLKRFSSYDAMKNYVKTTTGYFHDWNHGGGEGGDLQWSANSKGGAAGAGTAPPSAACDGSGGSDYSGTNVQVEGVDEADIVKTDGKNIYAVSGNKVVIAKAYPAEEAKVLATLRTDNVVEELFINENRLVVFEVNSSCYSGYYCSHYAYQYSYPKTFIKIYDVTDHEKPVLKQNISISGTYFNSRMIDHHVYAVAVAYMNYRNDNNDILMPEIRKSGAGREIKATEIGYFEVPAASYSYTTIVSVDLKSDDQSSQEVYLTDYANCMYASDKSIYLASVDCYRALWRGDGSEKTVIHKFSIDDGKVNYICSGNVPGHILNQFSMDEHKEHFRIATTEGWSRSSNSGNNVFVLDKELDIVGKLEGLAPGERIYSARFMGDRCYLVTFKQVDPFFVIDMKDPASPKMLGELKIPGYSDYLHPYDENHVIGIGKDTVDAGSFAWYQGVKLSLFDVTDVKNPKEISKYIIGDRGSNSPALHDHKAFLFSKSKNLLVIPVEIYEINKSKYPDNPPPYAWGEYIWQGAYVFSLDPESGFVPRGGITHNNKSSFDRYNDYNEYKYYIQRSFYIKDVLYTVSEKAVKMNSLDSLEEVNKLWL